MPRFIKSLKKGPRFPSPNEEPEESSQLAGLPVEVLHEIFRWLSDDARSLYSTLCTCKKLSVIIREQNDFWLPAIAAIVPEIVGQLREPGAALPLLAGLAKAKPTLQEHRQKMKPSPELDRQKMEPSPERDALSAEPPRSLCIKLVVVGDTNLGKAFILHSYIKGYTTAVEDPFITHFDNYEGIKRINGIEFTSSIWDTTGQESFARIRTLGYPRTDVFLLLFSLLDRQTLMNAKKVWAPEIRNHCPDAAIVLGGTEVDALDGHSKGDEAKRLLALVKDPKRGPVTFQEVQAVAKKIRAASFIPFSPRPGNNLSLVFDECWKAALCVRIPSLRQPARKGK
jgi:small GTP-binding protein